MSIAPYVKSNHPYATASHAATYSPASHSVPLGHSIPARRPVRRFVASPVAHSPAALQIAPIVAGDPMSAADAVLELLRAVNRNRSH